jgi:DNA replication protein DnaC
VRRCECWERKRSPFAAGVPAEFHAATFDTYSDLPGNERAVKAARAFLEAESGDLFVHGPVGSGKTRLACALINEHHRRHTSGWFARVPRLLFDLQPKRSGEGQDLAESLIDRAMTASLLVLDDVGADRDAATDFTRRTLLMIYEARGDAGLRTIWTSNLAMDQLAQFMADDRLASRIAGRSTVVDIRTADQRLAKYQRPRAIGAVR